VSDDGSGRKKKCIKSLAIGQGRENHEMFFIPCSSC
jgi:hypothetical protein